MNVPWIITGTGKTMVRADKITGVTASVKPVGRHDDDKAMALVFHLILDNGHQVPYTMVINNDEYPPQRIDEITQSVMEEIRHNVNTAIEDSKIDDGTSNAYCIGRAPYEIGNNANSNKE